MEKNQVSYSELIVRNSSQQPDGRPQIHKNKDASTEQEVTYAGMKNSKSSQQRQHRKSKNIPNSGPEQQATYTEVKNAKPSQLRQHRTYKDAQNTFLECDQQVTYTDLKLTGYPQLQGGCEIGQSKDSLSPPWRLIAGILGILCLGLVATVAIRALWIFWNCSCTPCSGNWVQFDTSCFRYSAELKPWKESQQACKSQKPSLLNINNTREMVLSHKLLVYINACLPE
uniref:C-type lectin domain-containing protein n=1 Tax=Ornithorhynchus anatinus TaxID=9258 RepID=F7F8T9_ORNAN